MSGEHPCWSYHTTIGCHGWFHCRSSPSSPAFEDESDDGSSSDDADEDDDDDGLSSDDEMST